MVSGDTFFTVGPSYGGQRWGGVLAKFLATTTNYWKVPMGALGKFCYWGTTYRCTKKDWIAMGLDPYKPAVIPRKFWQSLKKFYPKRPTDFKVDDWYYTTSQWMAMPRYVWGRPPDSLPWKMLFMPIRITATYVSYLGLMYQPPTPRTKLPRVLREGKQIVTSAGYEYWQGRVTSQGWKGNPFGKFGCEPGYGTSRFSWATMRGWKPSVIEEPTVRQSTRADLWKAIHGAGWSKLNELVEAKRQAVRAYGPALKQYTRERWQEWWDLPMEDILESLDNKERKTHHRGWFTTDEDATDREHAIQHLQDAMTGPGYELDTLRTVDLVNYPFQNERVVVGKMTVDAFSKVWKLPAPRRTYTAVRDPASQHGYSHNIVED